MVAVARIFDENAGHISLIDNQCRMFGHRLIE
jgi:hypothetical protein